MIAVLADTHLPRGARRLPSQCMRLLREASFIVHAGDFTRVAVLVELERLAPVAAVVGNMDEPALAEQLSAQLVVETEGMRIGVVHDAGTAAGRYERLLARFPACELVVYGHTHAPELVQVGGTWILNPGSPTERRRAPAHTMGVVRDGRPELVTLG